MFIIFIQYKQKIDFMEFFINKNSTLPKLKMKMDNDDRNEFRECWNQFIDYVNDNIDSNLASFLINLKEQILKEWKYRDKIMVRYFEFEFIKYFVENDKNKNLYDYWKNLP